MPHQGDVICFVKKFICDSSLAQDPLLVMTHERAFGFAMIPEDKSLGV